MKTFTKYRTKDPMIKQVINHFKDLTLLLLILSVTLSCGEGEMSPLSDCEKGLDYYFSNVEANVLEVDFKDCVRELDIQVTNLSYVSNPIFSPLDENQILFLRAEYPIDVDTPQKLIHFDMCSGMETILDIGRFHAQQIKWTELDWIYYAKERTYYKVRSNGEDLQKVDVPRTIANPAWNKNRDKVVYIKQLVLSQRIIVADENFVPIDSLGVHRFAGPFEWISDDELYYSFVNHNEDVQEGIYKYNMTTRSSELLVAVDHRSNITDINASIGNEQVFWMTDNGLYKTNTSTGATEEIASNKNSRNYSWISRSATSDYLMTLRSDIEVFDNCEGESTSYLTMIDVNTGVMKNVDLNRK